MTQTLRRLAPRLASLAALASLLACPALAADEPPRSSTDGRLISMDSAEPIDRVVIGLQRTAVPVFAGFALDTSLITDIGLAPNVGVRWAAAFGTSHVAVGARYTFFVGEGVYSSIVSSAEHVIKTFAPALTGPSAYAAYGLELGILHVNAELRYAHWSYDYGSAVGAVSLAFGGGWKLIGEIGYRFLGAPPLHAAGGIRYGGEHFGFGLGVAYAGFEDPMLPAIPVLPSVDLWWSF